MNFKNSYDIQPEYFPFQSANSIGTKPMEKKLKYDYEFSYPNLSKVTQLPRGRVGNKVRFRLFQKLRI